MLRVGLTGGIGSGKTVVAEIFRTLGIPVLNADRLAAQLMQEDEAIKAAVTQLFGREIISEGSIDRKRVAAIVFADGQKLAALNSIIHPPVIAAGERWLSEQKAPYVIKEAAILFEAGSALALDLVIGVSAPEELRIERAMQRDGVTREHVLTRMARQMNEAEKMARCDRVLVNDGEQMLLPQVLGLHTELLKRSANA